MLKHWNGYANTIMKVYPVGIGFIPSIIALF
jgi:hypothetical protein